MTEDFIEEQEKEVPKMPALGHPFFSVVTAQLIGCDSFFVMMCNGSDAVCG
jgi:hypothetical protein